MIFEINFKNLVLNKFKLCCQPHSFKFSVFKSRCLFVQHQNVFLLFDPFSLPKEKKLLKNAIFFTIYSKIVLIAKSYTYNFIYKPPSHPTAFYSAHFDYTFKTIFYTSNFQFFIFWQFHYLAKIENSTIRWKIKGAEM